MSEINLEYVYTEKVHLDFVMAFRRASSIWKTCWIMFWLVLLLPVIDLALLVLLAYSGKPVDWPSEISDLIVVVFILGLGLWLWQCFPAYIFRKTPAANKITQWKITENGVDATIPGCRFAFEWIAFTKIVEADACFLCYTQPGLAWCISKPAFPSPVELDLFRSWIRGHNVKFLP